MYARILVPLDGSDFSKRILPWVGLIATTTGVPVTFYRAVDKGGKGAAEEELRALADANHAQAICAEVTGGAAGAILEEAARTPGTLVAMSSHGRTGALRALLGSTALDVLRTGGNPILVYRPVPPVPGSSAVAAITRIIVPLDGSPLSESIIPEAIQLARWLKARVVVVSVIDPATAGESDVAVGDVVESGYVHTHAARITAEHGIDAGWEVLHGDPQQAIPQFVRSYPQSMLAMTTRGRSALQSALVGSVTAAALRDSGVPVYTRLP